MNKKVTIELSEAELLQDERCARMCGFASVGEYLANLLKVEPVRTRERLSALDAAVAQGLAEADAGLGAPADEVFDRLEKRFRAAARKGR